MNVKLTCLIILSWLLHSLFILKLDKLSTKAFHFDTLGRTKHYFLMYYWLWRAFTENNEKLIGS